MLNSIFLIDNKEYIEKVKEVGINTFLFPFKGYSLGFNNYFELDEIIEENSYLYINRNLDCDDIDIADYLKYEVLEINDIAIQPSSNSFKPYPLNCNYPEPH